MILSTKRLRSLHQVVCRRQETVAGPLWGDVGCEGILECLFEVALSLSLAHRSDEGKVFEATHPHETGVFELA